MSRLESIKERLEANRNGYHNQITDDYDYLLQRLERYETALKEVTVSTSHNHAKFVADKALKEDETLTISQPSAEEINRRYNIKD